MNVQASVVHFLHHIITKRYKITMIDIHAVLLCMYKQIKYLHRKK